MQDQLRLSPAPGNSLHWSTTATALSSSKEGRPMLHTSRQRAAAGLLVLAYAAWAWSADEPGQKDKDRRLAATLKDVINRGATLYNSGYQNGSYHMFVGALL